MFKKSVAMVIAWSAAASAGAGGWYHMPTSAWQCMGWGFGPGYHAPLLLGPHQCGSVMRQRVVRLPAAPHGVGVGCGGCDQSGLSRLPGTQFDSPTYEESIHFSTPEPIAVPPAVEQPSTNVTPLDRPLFGPPAAPTLSR